MAAKTAIAEKSQKTTKKSLKTPKTFSDDELDEMEFFGWGFNLKFPHDESDGEASDGYDADGKKAPGNDILSPEGDKIPLDTYLKNSIIGHSDNMTDDELLIKVQHEIEAMEAQLKAKKGLQLTLLHEIEAMEALLKAKEPEVRWAQERLGRLRAAQRSLWIRASVGP